MHFRCPQPASEGQKPLYEASEKHCCVLTQVEREASPGPLGVTREDSHSADGGAELELRRRAVVRSSGEADLCRWRHVQLSTTTAAMRSEIL